MLHSLTDTKELRTSLFQAEKLNEYVWNTIQHNKWLQIWVPKKYGGLGLSLSEGLKILRELAEVDGSLGWLVTLCSGANYFARNLKPEVAKAVFSDDLVCFGGSGMLGGTAEKIGSEYLINGRWNFATGAPFLTHFTLNAKLVENGKVLKNERDEPVFLSFLLKASQAEIIPNWKAMGMIATSSEGFEVNNQLVSQDYAFQYNEFFGDEVLDRIPFQLFADLTLIVNYLGMAQHFSSASKHIRVDSQHAEFDKYIQIKTNEILSYSVKFEEILSQSEIIAVDLKEQLHAECEVIVKKLSHFFLDLYPKLGVKAASLNEEVNQIFRDFFTATQHKNFR